MIKRGRQRYWRGLMDVFEPRVLLSGWGITQIGQISNLLNESAASTPVVDKNGNIFEWDGDSIFEIRKGSSAPILVADLGNLNDVSGEQWLNRGSLFVDGEGNIYGYRTNYYPATGGEIFEIAVGSRSAQVKVRLGNDAPGGTPQSVAIDPFGNAYTVLGNHVLERIDIHTGQVTTLFTASDNDLGAPLMDKQGDIFLGDGENVFEIKQGGDAITTVTTLDPHQGPYFNYTSDFAVDSKGDIFAFGVPWQTNKLVLYEIPAGASAAVILYTPSGYSDPSALTVDSQGDAFFADGEGFISEIPAGTGTVKQLAQLADSERGVLGLTVDGKGNVFGVSQEFFASLPWGPFEPPTKPVVFEVFPEGADHLAIQAPDTVHAPQGPTVTVDVLGPDGQIDISDDGLVTLFLNTGPYGGNLGGTVTVRAVNGVAKFDHLTLDVNGTYTVTATQWGVDSATSGGIGFTGGFPEQIPQPIGDFPFPIRFIGAPIIVGRFFSAPVFVPPSELPVAAVVPQRVAARVENVVDRGMAVNVVEQDERVIAPVNQGFAYFGEALVVHTESGENVQKQELPAAVKGASADSDANAAVPVKDVPQAKDAAAAKEDAGQEQGKTEETPAQGEGAKKLEKKKEEKKGKDVGKVGIVGAGMVMMMGVGRRRENEDRID